MSLVGKELSRITDVLALGSCTMAVHLQLISYYIHVKVNRVKHNLIAGVSCRDFAAIKNFSVHCVLSSATVQLTILHSS